MSDHFEIYRKAQSLPALFFNSSKNRQEKPFLWTKKNGVYESETWGSVEADILALAKALKGMGVSPGDRVALVSENRSEWPISDLAIMTSVL